MDEQLKERIVGAVVLMALAVIFVPMILSGPKDPPSTRVEALEPKDFTSRIVALEPNAPSSSAKRADEITDAKPDLPAANRRSAPPKASPAPKSVSSTDSASPAQPKADVDVATAKPVPESKPSVPDKAPTPAPVRAKAPPPAPKLKLSETTAEAPSPATGWVVQLGSFADKRNAQGLKARLVKMGYRAFVKTSVAAGSEVTRVYVGPESSRDKAKAQLPALLKETKLKGIVTRFDG